MDPFPQEAPHFFTNVDFNLLPEIDYLKLEEISQLAKVNQTTGKYLELREALIKLWWAKLSATRAVEAEKRIMSYSRQEYIISGISVQSEHEKSIFEFIVNVKSALDAISTFCNSSFELGASRGDIDIKWKRFREKLIAKESAFEALLGNFDIWLQEKRNKSDSIISLRDYWIHQSTPWIVALSPPTSLGALPIPKNFRKINLASDDSIENELTDENFWTTFDFLNYHFHNFVVLFTGVINICIQKERISQPDLRISRTENKISIFPVRPTSNGEYKGMGVII